MVMMSIQDVMKNEGVLITGGTGFMGKVLTEKLLRSCPDVKHIYLMAREKKGKSIHQRLDEIFQDPLFSVLEEQQPKFRYKVTGLNGDCALPGLGLSEEDRAMVAREVGVVFHGAATVRFDEKLRVAYNTNVRGTKEMIWLAQEMKGLKAFVHISTAYANCHLQYIEEKFYEAPIECAKLDQIIESIDDDELLESLISKLLGKWPNTYAYTKAVAEHVVKDLGKGLPIAIFRPAAIVGTAYEPIIGWTDNVYGPTGLVVGAGCGVLRCVCANLDYDANIVPVDMCVSAAIASAWETVNDRNNKELPSSVEDEIPIYNYVSTEKPLVWREFKRLLELHGPSVPPMKAMWYYYMTTTKYIFLHTIFTWFLHYLPAVIIQTTSKITGQECPNLIEIYRKIDKFSTVLNYFSLRQWKFTNDNVQALWKRLSPEDQNIYRFDMKQLDWDRFFYNYIRGLRVYLLKDDLSTLPQAMVRWRRFYWAHQVIKTLFFFLVLRIAWFVGTLLYKLTSWIASVQ